MLLLLVMFAGEIRLSDAIFLNMKILKIVKIWAKMFRTNQVKVWAGNVCIANVCISYFLSVYLFNQPPQKRQGISVTRPSKATSVTSSSM